MVRVTVFLLALALNSSPVAAALCVSGCPPSHTSAGVVHHGMTPNDTPAVSRARSVCAVPSEEGAVLPQNDHRAGAGPIPTTGVTVAVVAGAVQGHSLADFGSNRQATTLPRVLRL